MSPLTEEDLQRDVDQFFSSKTEHFLDQAIQLVYRRAHPSKERDPLPLLDQFIDTVKASDLSKKQLEPSLGCIEKWKREFTQKILIPSSARRLAGMLHSMRKA